MRALAHGSVYLTAFPMPIPLAIPLLQLNNYVYIGLYFLKLSATWFIRRLR